jgi:T5SS/PEP-CTERM-associated repeat protein
VTITKTTADNVNIGAESGGSGTVTVTGLDSSLTTKGLDNEVSVGAVTSSTGSLLIEDGAKLNTLLLQVGEGGTGTATITGTDSTVTVSNDDGRFSGTGDSFAGFVRVSRFSGSTGTLSVLAGGSLAIRAGIGTNTDTVGPSLQVATDADSTGTVLVGGSGSIIDITTLTSNATFGSFLQLGVGGTGAMTISNSGAVNLTGDNSFVKLGLGSAATGALNISSSGSLTINGSGGKAGMDIGSVSGGTGAVTVSGSGSTLVLNGNSGGLSVGDSGTGTLTVSSGGAVTITSAAGDNLLIGASAGGIGTVTVTGSGSSLTTAGLDNVVSVGFAAGATGSLLVESAAQVKTLFLDVGRNGTGTATVSGAESAIIVSNDNGRFSGAFDYEAGFVRVGKESGGVGNLNALNGGHVHIRPGLTANTDTTVPALIIARDLGSTGSVLVDGSNSIIDLLSTSGAGGALNNGGELQVGRGGAGDLTISNSGAVNVSALGIFSVVDRLTGSVGQLDVQSGGSVSLNALTGTSQHILGVENISSGTMTVTGQFSSFTMTGGVIDLTIGKSGTGALTVSNGGSLTVNSTTGNSFMVIGSEANSSGTVTVTGAGSTLTVNGVTPAIFVGVLGAGTLTVSDGGLVTAQNVIVGSLGTINDSGGTINGTVTVTGTVAPGASVGTLTVDGDFTLSAGTLDIEIGAGGDTDQLIVTQTLDVRDGVVELSFLDGFLPGSGETFQFATGEGGVLFDASGVSSAISGIAAEDISAPTLSVDGSNLSVTFNDSLSAGTTTHFFGSDRDDTVIFDASDNLRADGGSGSDTLKLGGGGETLDLLSVAASLYTSFEEIDLAGTGNNDLILDELSLQNITDGENAGTLIVSGDAGDEVTAAGFSDTNRDVTIDGQSYSVLNGNTADVTLLVDNDISASLA